MIYKDNKTLLSSKTAIEVHLTKKNNNDYLNINLN